MAGESQLPSSRSNEIMATVNYNPPWYTLRAQFQNTFGCDPQVTIGELDTSKPPYRLPIIVDDQQKGTSLRTIIRTVFPIANLSVITDVTNKQGVSWQTIVIKDSTQLKDVFTFALTGNPLFVETVLIPPAPGGFNFYNVAVIFTRSVVQFYNDDLSEYYHNYNGVTANVFGDLIKLEFANNLHVQKGTVKDK